MTGIRLVFPAALAWLLAALAAAAQTPAPAAPPAKAKPAPYKPVAIKLPADSKDAGFIAFRHELAKVAKARVYSDLARLVVRRRFFWDRDFGGAFDPTKSGVENLAVAVRLEARNGAGWGTLVVFAAEATTKHEPSRPGVVCSPGQPSFSEPDFDHLLDLTKTSSSDWLYPRADAITVYAAPRVDSAVIETLGLNFVRVLREGTGAVADNGAAWLRVLTPTGRIGFVDRTVLLGLEPRRLCYRKDVTGRWQIAGYIGGSE
jgi:hypothetical protein